MVVENPQGVSGKYEVNRELGVIELDRIPATPIPFPFDYGFMPGTWCNSDDDPIDIMVIMPVASFPGCVLNVRVIGMYRLVDTGEQDDKIIAVCEGDETFSDVKDVKDVPRQYLERIEFFWKNYVGLASDKETEGHGWADKAEAEHYINSCIERYAKKFNK